MCFPLNFKGNYFKNNYSEEHFRKTAFEKIAQLIHYKPVDTRRCFSLYETTIRRRRRRTDIL